MAVTASVSDAPVSFCIAVPAFAGSGVNVNRCPSTAKNPFDVSRCTAEMLKLRIEFDPPLVWYSEIERLAADINRWYPNAASNTD